MKKIAVKKRERGKEAAKGRLETFREEQ